MFSIAEVQTKVIHCNCANRSCLLRVVHTKAIAALTQFCDFLMVDFVVEDFVIGEFIMGDFVMGDFVVGDFVLRGFIIKDF